jgi:molecular chaperone HscA
VEATIAVRPSYGLGDEDIARMLTESFSAAEQDMIERGLRESRVEAERLVLATRAALLADGNLLSTEQRAVVEGLLAAVQVVREGNDQNRIDAAVEALAQGTEEFAAQRMNRGIRNALAGKRVEDV